MACSNGTDQRSAGSRDENRPHGAIRAMSDAEVGMAGFDPPVPAHREMKLGYLKDIRGCEIPGPGVIRLGVTDGQFRGIPLQQVNFPAGNDWRREG